jgi:nucleoside-diphosphate-sugar epimerase
MVEMIADALDVAITPSISGEFRPGEMRHLTSDITRIRSSGYASSVDLATGIGRYIAWIKAQGDVREYFAAAETILRAKRIVQRVVVAA